MPEIEEFPEDIEVTVGEGVTFKVFVGGVPLPTISWFRGGKEICSNAAMRILPNGSLEIPFVDVEEEGRYKMVATNSVGNAEGEVTLTVISEEHYMAEGMKEVLDRLPIPVEMFAKYLEEHHANRSQKLLEQYQV